MKTLFIRYVAGFLITPDKTTVVLIRKNHPEWQRGRYNGVGGKVEPGEKPLAAMQREFREEAGVDISDWVHFCTLQGPFWEVE